MLKEIIGWKTKRKIIVFESDDWGSFRFKNRKIRDKYIPNPKSYDWMRYNDCFESKEDLNGLSQVLLRHKDKNENHPCFTFLFNPANPDFKKIKDDNFEKYYSESFLNTLKKRDDGDDILNWYNNALDNKIIEIGFHGREHLNEHAWMQDLNKNDYDTISSFEDRIWGESQIQENQANKSYRSTYHISSYDELNNLKLNIEEGVNLINNLFSQSTTYFLPPDGPYDLSLNKTLVENNIKFIGLAKKHKNPLEKKWYQNHFFWNGKKTKEGLIVITRNVIFEPSSPKNTDWVKKAMNGIDKAFKYKNPAVISTHRANYIGSLNIKNRENGLSKLEQLLNQILSRWPDAEFMTSSQLGYSMGMK